METLIIKMQRTNEVYPAVEREDGTLEMLPYGGDYVLLKDLAEYLKAQKSLLFYVEFHTHPKFHAKDMKNYTRRINKLIDAGFDVVEPLTKTLRSHDHPEAGVYKAVLGRPVSVDELMECKA